MTSLGDQCMTLDQDYSTNCNPVDCVLKYNGEKSFFNTASKECEAVPVCMSDPNKCLPEMVSIMFY